MSLPIVSIIVAGLSLTLSATTAWFSLFHRGTVRMTKPTTIAFLDARGSDGPKVYLRSLLYSTSRRGRVVESMFVRLRRGESNQTFNVWVYGERNDLARGSGIYVGHDGVTFNHHFVLPRDGTQFRFLPGDYDVEVHASLVNRRSPVLLMQSRLHLSDEQAVALRDKGSGVFFDWGPEAGTYHSHIDRRLVEYDVTDALDLPAGG